MTNRQPPSDDDPAQLPVEPEFPAHDLPSEPLADEGKPGSEKDATSFVKERP